MDDLLTPTTAGASPMGKNPNAKSKAAGVGSPVKPSGKKGGGVKVPRTGAVTGKNGKGYIK